MNYSISHSQQQDQRLQLAHSNIEEDESDRDIFIPASPHREMQEVRNLVSETTRTEPQ